MKTTTYTRRPAKTGKSAKRAAAGKWVKSTPPEQVPVHFMTKRIDRNRLRITEQSDCGNRPSGLVEILRYISSLLGEEGRPIYDLEEVDGGVYPAVGIDQHEVCTLVLYHPESKKVDLLEASLQSKTPAIPVPASGGQMIPHEIKMIVENIPGMLCSGGQVLSRHGIAITRIRGDRYPASGEEGLPGPAGRDLATLRLHVLVPSNKLEYARAADQGLMEELIDACQYDTDAATGKLTQVSLWKPVISIQECPGGGENSYPYLNMLLLDLNRTYAEAN